jgi:hypothetical protein
LKNPVLKYVHTYSYKDNKQEEFLIPAVVFEVENPETTEYYFNVENIVVPLVRDFYKYDGKGYIIGTNE